MNEVNERGNVIERIFLFNADRYRFDLNDCRYDKGWVQFDTTQDAWYFGVWVNKDKRQIITYAEGDVTKVTCPTDESYNKEIEDMIKFYEPGVSFITVNEEGTTHYIQNRQSLFIKEEITV
jgi:hypothetical protein